MEILYDLIYGLLAGIILVGFIYFASKFQMKGWLVEIEKFLNNKYLTNKSKENGNKTQE